MNDVKELLPRAEDRIIRTDDGGIDYEHYRIRARQERAKAVRQALAWLGRRLFAPSISRRIEVDWRPEASLKR